MRYYALYDEMDTLIAVGTGRAGVEISGSEYVAIMSDIRKKASLEDALYKGEITVEEIPEPWRKEIPRWVDERIAAEASSEAGQEDFISALNELGVKFHEENGSA